MQSSEDGTGGVELVPDLTDNEFKFLRVNSEGTQLEWAAIPAAAIPDWEQNNNSEGDFIKHKPAIIRDTSSSSLSPDRNTGVRLNNITGNVASGNYALAEGFGTSATGVAAHAEGNGTTASALNAHAEGESTTASGRSSHAEGYQSVASGARAHAEGLTTTASGDWTHAEGALSQATANFAHAEGNNTVASGLRSHAEGYQSRAVGNTSHAEGSSVFARGDFSHAEGFGTITSEGAMYAHVEGLNNEARTVGTTNEQTLASGN